MKRLVSLEKESTFRCSWSTLDGFFMTLTLQNDLQQAGIADAKMT
jgi:hypothetical protein